VAVIAGRRVDLLPVLLGIMLQGAAYVPIDPQFPEDRKRYILDAAKVAVVLTDQPIDGKAQAMRVSISDAVSTPTDQWQHTEVPISAAAYVLFTSGSTGKPKGIAVSHASVLNLLTHFSDMLSPDLRIFSTTTISFDISVLELFAPLLGGGSVTLCSDDGLMDVEVMGRELAASGATVMQATPTQWQMMLDAGLVFQLEWKLCGGEALQSELARQLAKRPGRLLNVYGPTETTIWSTCAEIGADCRGTTIGRPIANTSVHVLDNDLRPVPVGADGELFIGGEGVAYGYLGSCRQTAERFLPDPYSSRQGARFFRTGDVVRVNYDGDLVFVGRNDQQVKVRGYRIELEEIERALAGHPDVDRAFVQAIPSEAGSSSLAAFVTLHPQVAGQSEEAILLKVRDALSERLPGYMIPASFAVLDRIPKTLNGKTDRSALANHGRQVRMAVTTERVEPATETEQRLLAIWRSVLGNEDIGSTDDFFRVGGHSLLALRVVLKARKEFGVDLPVASLLTAPTVRELARLLGQDDDQLSAYAPIPMNDRRNGTPLSLFHAMGGHVYCYTHLARAMGRPVLGFKTDDADLNPSLEETAQKYVTLIKQQQPVGPYFVGGWCMGASVAVEVARQLEAQGETVAKVFLISASLLEPVPERLVVDDTALMIEVFGGSVPMTLETVRSQGTLRQQMAYIIEQATSAGALRPDVQDLNGAMSLLDIYRNNARALFEHPHLPCKAPLVLLRTQAEMLCDTEARDLGWGRVAEGGLEIVFLEGNHYTLLGEEHSPALARAIEAKMNETQAKE
jgi:amino acid adenylation domain-containing protein